MVPRVSLRRAIWNFLRWPSLVIPRETRSWSVISLMTSRLSTSASSKFFDMLSRPASFRNSTTLANPSFFLGTNDVDWALSCDAVKVVVDCANAVVTVATGRARGGPGCTTPIRAQRRRSSILLISSSSSSSLSQPEEEAGGTESTRLPLSRIGLAFLAVAIPSAAWTFPTDDSNVVLTMGPGRVGGGLDARTTAGV